MATEVTVTPTTPIDGQKPGTSGLRKKTKVFMEGSYLNNFVESVFRALSDEQVPLAGGTLVISGDGRFWNKEAIQVIIKMAVAWGVKTIWIGSEGLLSTPAVSAVIRCRAGGFVPIGGFILSASHNPGGIDEDFGIKYNCENGGPAPEVITNKIYDHTTSLDSFKICGAFPAIDVNTIGTTVVEGVTVEVFDCTEDHLYILKKCFDFPAIKAFVSRPDFSLVYDSMNGVNGPYARKVFVEEFGLPDDSCMNAVPKEDFGGHDSPSHGHADPNLTHAVELVAAMGIDKRANKIETGKPIPDFGAAADGDADRNMILGKQFFVSPSDSLAMIAANAALIPWFASQGGLKACARSMPTSCALDKVAEKRGMQCFEVPTGWKFFGNLMDSGTDRFPGKPTYTPFLCGEESFGTGSDHAREKDGMWAVLAWLQILAARNPEPSAPLVTVEQIATEHWQEFGRNYYARYDFEGVDKEGANKMMAAMTELTGTIAGKSFGEFTIAGGDVFNYTDPVDESVSKNQGIRFMFTDGSRIVFRLSGTGVAGATVRLYLEKYVAPGGTLDDYVFDVVKPLATVAMEVSQLTAFCDRTEPTVIT